MCPSDDPATGARSLTTAEVEQVIDDFVSAAVRAQRAGFHGVELHGAHGYLLCQFLSPDINRRTDRYGGSLDNRSSVLFEIVDGIRARCGDGFALAVRLSPERFGMRIDEVTEVFGRLVDGGKVDLIDMSLWDIDKEPSEEGHGGCTLLEVFASLPRDGVRLGVAGKIHGPVDVRRVLDAGVDVAVLGRVAILHHDYANRMKADAGFVPRRPPVSAAVLAEEGVSATFAQYLGSAFKGFVDE